MAIRQAQQDQQQDLTNLPVIIAPDQSDNPPTVLVPTAATAAPELTYADLVEILATYSLIHEPAGHPYEDNYYGYTERMKKTIHILSHGDLSDAKDTVLHEALHIKCYQMMVECTETMIETKSQEIYKKLFVLAPEIK